MVQTVQGLSHYNNVKSQVNFKGKNDKEKSPVKSAPAVASSFIPGTGQMMNGEWGKGLGIMGGYVGLGGLAAAGQIDTFKNIGMNVAHNAGKSKAVMNTVKNVRGPAAIVVAGLGALALSIYSISDAVKGANKDLVKPNQNKVVIETTGTEDVSKQKKVGVKLDIQEG